MSKIFPKSTYDQVICLTQPNNWLKMHGYPMRRKPRGARKKKRYFYIDEIYTLFEQKDTEKYLRNLFKTARKYTPPKEQ